MSPDRSSPRPSRPAPAGALLVLLALLPGLPLAWPGRPAGSDALELGRRELRIPAVARPAGFQRLVMPGYHFLCWQGGRVAPLALLTTPVSDLAIQRGLETLGADPGNNLEQATWDERHDPSSEAAGRHVAGTPIRVEVLIDRLRYHMDELVTVPGSDGRSDVRLGGHLQFRPAWRSGCVLCLVSCPGGRLSNGRWTLHDYAVGRATHTLTTLGRELLTEGREVTVILTPRDD